MTAPNENAFAVVTLVSNLPCWQTYGRGNVGRKANENPEKTPPGGVSRTDTERMNPII